MSKPPAKTAAAKAPSKADEHAVDMQPEAESGLETTPSDAPSEEPSDPPAPRAKAASRPARPASKTAAKPLGKSAAKGAGEAAAVQADETQAAVDGQPVAEGEAQAEPAAAPETAVAAPPVKPPAAPRAKPAAAKTATPPAKAAEAKAPETAAPKPAAKTAADKFDVKPVSSSTAPTPDAKPDPKPDAKPAAKADVKPEPRISARAAAKSAAAKVAPQNIPPQSGTASPTNRFIDRFAPAPAANKTMSEAADFPKTFAKDPKLANAWKTKAGRELTEPELLSMPDGEYMNDKQLDYFRAALQQQKDDLLSNAGETTEHLREDTSIVPDPVDRATIEEEHALELRTRDRERKLLKKIAQSLTRVDSGEYGYCDETGEPIGLPRLLARPTATLSLEAQQRRELKQKMFGD